MCVSVCDRKRNLDPTGQGRDHADIPAELRTTHNAFTFRKELRTTLRSPILFSASYEPSPRVVPLPDIYLRSNSFRYCGSRIHRHPAIVGSSSPHSGRKPVLYVRCSLDHFQYLTSEAYTVTIAGVEPPKQLAFFHGVDHVIRPAGPLPILAITSPWLFNIRVVVVTETGITAFTSVDQFPLDGVERSRAGVYCLKRPATAPLRHFASVTNMNAHFDDLATVQTCFKVS